MYIYYYSTRYIIGRLSNLQAGLLISDTEVSPMLYR